MKRENQAPQIFSINISTPELLRYMEQSEVKAPINSVNNEVVDISHSLNSVKNEDTKISPKKDISKELKESKDSKEKKNQSVKIEFQKDIIKDQIIQIPKNAESKIRTIQSEHLTGCGNLNESKKVNEVKSIPPQTMGNEFKNRVTSFRKQEKNDEKRTQDAKIQCHISEGQIKNIILDGLNRIKNATENISKEILQEKSENEIELVDEITQFPEEKLKVNLSIYTIKNQIEIPRVNIMKSPCRFVDLYKIRKLIKDGFNIKIKSETPTTEIISIKNKTLCLVLSLKVDRIDNNPVVEVKKLEHNGFCVSEQLKSYLKKNFIPMNQTTSQVIKIIEEFIESSKNPPKDEIVEID